MELKFLQSLKEIGINNRSNRTFMELKFVQYEFGTNRVRVLIVPLWN